MVYLERVAESPELVYTIFKAGGLYISRSIFQPGMWQTMNFPQEVRFCDLASKHFQPRGRLVNTDGALPPREPGWMSTTDEFLVPAGQYRREAEGETEVWCVQVDGKGGDTSHVTLLKLAPGESCQVPNGHYLFLATGECTANGRTLTSPAHFHLQSGDKTISAQTETYLMHWPTPSTS